MWIDCKIESKLQYKRPQLAKAAVNTSSAKKYVVLLHTNLAIVGTGVI